MSVQRLLLIACLLCVGAPSVWGQAGENAPLNPGDFFLGNPQETERKIKELERQALRNIEQGRVRLAIDNLKELVTLDPYEGDYHISLGVLFAGVKNYDEARRKFQDFTDLGGNLAVAHLLIAETYIVGGDRERAFQNLRKAAENGLNLMKAARESAVLATYREDTEFIKLSLQLEQYQLDLGNKSDPMTGRIRTTDPEQTDDPEAGVVNRWSKEKQQEVLTAANRCLIRIEIFLSREDEQRAMDAYKELQGYLAHEDKISIPAFSVEFRKIIDQKEQIELRIKEIRLKYYYSQAQEIVEDMQRSFRNQDYPQIDTQFVEIKKIAEQMVNVDSEARSVAEVVMRVGQQWKTRAEVRREFAGKVLRVQGIVYHRGDPIAILNDKILTVGQRFEDMFVIGIERNQILFNFKGEEIPLVFRRY